MSQKNSLGAFSGARGPGVAAVWDPQHPTAEQRGEEQGKGQP